MQGTHEMRVMSSQHGDKKTTWNPTNAYEIEAARREFDYLVKGKKFTAFAVEKGGEKGARLHSFDPSIGAMILVPPLVGG